MSGAQIPYRWRGHAKAQRSSLPGVRPQRAFLPPSRLQVLFRPARSRSRPCLDRESEIDGGSVADQPPQRGDNSMAVLVRIPTPLRAVTKGSAQVQATADTVADLIDDLERQFPGLRERLVEEGGEIR